MALKDYYELSAMLRVQLPILLSFAVLKCLMGWVANFWFKALVPRRLEPLIQPLTQATMHILSVLYAVMLAASVFYSLLYLNDWSDKRYPHNSDGSRLMAGKPVPTLVCTEFDLVRVQGLVCAIGLLTLFTSSDAFTLGLSLCLFKSVADGSVFGVFLAACTYAAAMGVHNSHSKRFFAGMFTVNMLYSSLCYTDNAMNNRMGGAVLASCFGGLALIYSTTAWFYRSLWLAAKTGVVTGTRRVRQLVHKSTDPDNEEEFHEAVEGHAHAD